MYLYVITALVMLFRGVSNSVVHYLFNTAGAPVWGDKVFSDARTTPTSVTVLLPPLTMDGSGLMYRITAQPLTESGDAAGSAVTALTTPGLGVTAKPAVIGGLSPATRYRITLNVQNSTVTLPSSAPRMITTTLAGTSTFHSPNNLFLQIHSSIVLVLLLTCYVPYH